MSETPVSDSTPSSPDGPIKKVGKDIQTLHQRLEEERAGKFIGPPSRFPLPTTIVLYWIFFTILTVLFFFITRMVWHDFRKEAVFWGAPVILLTAHVLIFGAFYCKKHYGAFAELIFSTVVRSGIPLLAVLVFYFAINKILFKMTVLTIVILYMVSLPFEVWLLLPGKKTSEKLSETHPERD